jgi:hypothetical protein
MKRYVELKCSVCARTRNSLIDLKHYSTDKCSVTLGCEGRLFPIGYTNDGGGTLGVPPANVSNWYPRKTETIDNVVYAARTPNSTINSTLNSNALFPVGTGTREQFVLAVSDSVLGNSASANATITLKFITEQQVSKDYRQYTFRKTGSISTVNGVEDAVSRKVLRYNIVGTNPDEVQIYVNGVKRARGTGAQDYVLYDGTSSSAVPPNTVLFNSVITGTSTQIDVIVTKSSAQNQVLLTFNRVINDESRIGIGAWEGIDAVVNRGTSQRYSLFYCDISAVTQLTADIKMRLDATNPCVIRDPNELSFSPSNAVILLSNSKLFTELDRIRAKHLGLQSLVTSDVSMNYLMLKYINGEKRLMFPSNLATDVFPPYKVIRLRSPKFYTASMSSMILGNSDAETLDNFNFITGPDV